MPESTTMEIQQLPLWDQLKARRVPMTFTLEITARCNCDCRHCYINLPAGDRAARESELTVAEIDAIADQAVKLGSLWCVLSGGEPLLRPDFAEIYLRLKRKGLVVSVFTNATLITAAHVKLFQQYPPRDLEVTVYGVTRDTYERITRKPGSFDRFIHGLDLLTAGGVRFRLKAMALQSNFDQQAAIAEFSRARTKDYYRFDPQLHLRFDGDPVRNEEIRAERLTPAQVVALENGDEPRKQSLIKHCATFVNDEFAHTDRNHLFSCAAGSLAFQVGYDGRFRLCSSLVAEGTTYDLKAGTLADAWQNFVPRVRNLRSDRPEFLQSCRRCPIINLCLWCPAHAYLESGAMDGATPFLCAVAHARAENLKRLMTEDLAAGRSRRPPGPDGFRTGAN
jgi:radical SAM protein with 4Fe4S-binding SPASM domain